MKIIESHLTLILLITFFRLEELEEDDDDSLPIVFTFIVKFGLKVCLLNFLSVDFKLKFIPFEWFMIILMNDYNRIIPRVSCCRDVWY